MKAIVGLIGLCLVAFAAGMFWLDAKMGLCAMLLVLGCGLVIDAAKK